ncbi:hypothetical protein DOY81_014031 [Sarcophaga bullata]|nr:hypothetical protein DOY81_014031 [Sarcophaga bullata]
MKYKYLSPYRQGSAHNSLVGNISDLQQFLREKYLNGERNTWLLVDASSPLENLLITLFRSPEGGFRECRFNDIYATYKNIVEKTIGVLKNRFR